MRVFVDSDILIWHLRGRIQAKSLLEGLTDERDTELWIGAMQRAEIVFFMHQNEEKETMELLSLFKTHVVDQPIVDQAARLYSFQLLHSPHRTSSCQQ
jgi:hypothetical protein